MHVAEPLAVQHYTGVNLLVEQATQTALEMCLYHYVNLTPGNHN